MSVKEFMSVKDLDRELVNFLEGMEAKLKTLQWETVEMLMIFGVIESFHKAYDKLYDKTLARLHEGLTEMDKACEHLLDVHPTDDGIPAVWAWTEDGPEPVEYVFEWLHDFSCWKRSRDYHRNPQQELVDDLPF